MKLSEKIGKLFSGEAWEGLVDVYHRQRRALNIQEMVSDLESKGFDRIRKKYANSEDPKAWPKYVNAPKYLNLALGQARALHLSSRRPSRILDIGSGAGYFLYVCKQLGHAGTGLDLDFPPMYGEMFEMMEVPRVVWRIEAFRPLPDFGGRFNLVTAFAVCFNCHNTPQVWDVKEWEFFLDDLEKNVLAPGGEVYFELNPEKWGRYTPELRAFLVKRGARLDDRTLRLKSRR